MLRTCDGTDEFLTRYDHERADCPDFPMCTHHRPCDCGLTFDDVDHMTIYPHAFIPPPEERQALLEKLIAEHDLKV